MRRRCFIVAGLAASAIGCSRSKSPWRFFTLPEALTLQAICAHIIPQDQDPGAIQAGVVVFIDRQLTLFYKPLQPTYRLGIAAFDRASLHFAGSPFAALPPASQLHLLHQLERQPDTRPFFDLLVSHAMQGFYGDPRHGGNRDRVSWRMLGVASPPIRGRA